MNDMAKKKEMTPEEKLAEALVPADEQPYEVPDNWCWVRLKSISRKISDGSHNPPKDTGTGIPILSATNIHDNTIDIANASRWITEQDWLQENKRTELEFGDVLLTIVATIGRAAVVCNEHFALQRSVAVIKPMTVISPVYLMHYFTSPYNQSYMTENAKGTAQKGFYLQSLEKLLIPFPPLLEQNIIVDRIEALFAKLDEAKEKIQRVLDGAELRKSAILHKAFTGELTRKWRKRKGINDAGWKKAKMEEVCEKITCGKTPTGSISQVGDIPYLKVYNIVDNNVDFHNKPQFIPLEIHNGKLCSSKLHPGDVIMNIVGPPLRKIAIIPDEYPEWNMNQAIVRFRPLVGLMPKFLYYSLINPETLQDVINETKGVVGQANISISQSRNLVIDIPSLSEQQEIVRLLDDFLAKEKAAMAAAEQALTSIDLMKESILARAFRGQLGTNDPTEESSVELLKEILA